MTTVAVILSGCGFLDGSEIYETVATLLALDKRQVNYRCFAPNISQQQVIDFTSGEPMAETRNVLIEAARLSRGEIEDLSKADPSQYDALIFPGGFGAATNLCDFASKGTDYTINPDVKKFATHFPANHKPMGFICIAPALIPAICGSGITLTIGNDPETSAVLEKLGATHVTCDALNVIVDTQHKIVTTPAYMTAKRIHEVFEGIDKLVAEVLQLAK